MSENHSQNRGPAAGRRPMGGGRGMMGPVGKRKNF